jgi:hypothetical protein
LRISTSSRRRYSLLELVDLDLLHLEHRRHRPL